MSKAVTATIAFGAVLAYGGFWLFSAHVDRVTDTCLWLYRADGGPLAGATVDVDVRYPPGRGTFERAMSAKTAADGRLKLARERVKKFRLPLPQASGPEDYEQRLTAVTAGQSSVLGTSRSARALQVVFDGDAYRHTLSFGHTYDPFRDTDDFSAECARRVEALANAEAFLIGAATSAYGRAVRARLFARARAMGMVPSNEMLGDCIEIEVRSAPKAHCSVLVSLHDARGAVPLGFASP